jgi:hypothetical protein
MAHAPAFYFEVQSGALGHAKIPALQNIEPMKRSSEITDEYIYTGNVIALAVRCGFHMVGWFCFTDLSK